jgi:hypothetical protein
MHESLKVAKKDNAEDLHAYWHERMEPAGERGYRNNFFSRVIELAGTASHLYF